MGGTLARARRQSLGRRYQPAVVSRSVYLRRSRLGQNSCDNPNCPVPRPAAHGRFGRRPCRLVIRRNLPKSRPLLPPLPAPLIPISSDAAVYDDPPSEPSSPSGNLSGSRSSEPRRTSVLFTYVPGERHRCRRADAAGDHPGAVGIIFGALDGLSRPARRPYDPASIPIAVLSIAVFKLGRARSWRTTSCRRSAPPVSRSPPGRCSRCRRSSLSGGEHYFQYIQIATLAAIGGVLGILFMIPAAPQPHRQRARQVSTRRAPPAPRS